MAQAPILISDFAPVEPRPASTAPDRGDDAPWMQVLSDAERALMVGYAAIIWPDRPITRRLTRHVICNSTGQKFAAFKTLEECWLWAEAHDLAPVGLGCAGRVIALNPSRLPSPLSPSTEGALFDERKEPCLPFGQPIPGEQPE